MESFNLNIDISIFSIMLSYIRTPALIITPPQCLLWHKRHHVVSVPCGTDKLRLKTRSQFKTCHELEYKRIIQQVLHSKMFDSMFIFCSFHCNAWMNKKKRVLDRLRVQTSQKVSPPYLLASRITYNWNRNPSLSLSIVINNLY